MKKIPLLIMAVIILLFVAVVYFVYVKDKNSGYKQEDQTQITAISDSQQQIEQQTQTTTNGQFLFQNKYLEMYIFENSGWSYEEIGDGVLNITNSGYVVQIKPNTVQASGVEGGRFSEIAQGTAADLVLTMHPAEPCGFSEKTDLNNGLEMTSYYMDGNYATEFCNAPKDGKPRWYFSFVTNKGGGYFGDPAALGVNLKGQMRQFVITATFESSDINNLPTDNSSYREEMSEIIDMLKTLKFKN